MASYVSPAVRDKFETLSIDLKNTILERNVQINNVYDLIDVLESIVKGAVALMIIKLLVQQLFFAFLY